MIMMSLDIFCQNPDVQPASAASLKTTLAVQSVEVHLLVVEEFLPAVAVFVS